MGGKGQRRREKNFRAAHGGYTRLPPPPKTRDVDALPSKLRRLMDLTTAPSATKGVSGSLKGSTDTEHKSQKRDENNTSPKDEHGSKTTKIKEKGYTEKVIMSKRKDGNDEIAHKDLHDKRKSKRKRNQVNDLRFETTQDLGSIGLKRRERKKKYLEAKKNKNKKSKMEKSLDFPGLEEIKFGEVVEAPPKLLAVPKALKTVQDASHERLRLQAVQSYRDRKGWVSRPGINLPSPITPDPSF